MTTAADPARKALAQGAVDGEHVLVPDPASANRLHNKALAGTPLSGNTLRLTRVEAAHCVAAGWLAVAGGLDVAGLLAPGGRRAETDYLVYRDLRERGLVARPAAAAGRFDVWPRGTGEGTPAFRVLAFADADPITVADLARAADERLMAAVVDEDSVVTHYTLAPDQPQGTVAASGIPKSTATRLAGHVLVEDPQAAAACRKAFYGTPHGAAQVLSLTEAEHLRRQGHLALDGALEADPAVLATYGSLRTAGCVPRSGFRFGTHLRAYAGDPDAGHAEWLVHCAGPGPLAWPPLSRGVRLAHGVRKHFLVSLPGPEGVRFVRLAWSRP